MATNFTPTKTTFSDGDDILASDHQSNWSDIQTFLNTTGVHTYQAGTVNAAALSTDAVTTVKIQDSAVTTAKIADSNVTAAKIESSVNLPGSGVQVNSKRVITCNTNASANLALLRGSVASNGSISVGEGFTVNKSGTGTYEITFTTAFADAPVTVASSAAASVSASSPSTTGVTIVTLNASATPIDAAFHFICVGQRA